MLRGVLLLSVLLGTLSAGSVGLDTEALLEPCSSSGGGSSPAVAGWARSYGGPGAQSGASTSPMGQGAWLLGDHGSGDAADLWVLRTDPKGDLKQEYRLGGAAQEQATAVLTLADGGALLVGTTGSYGAQGDVWVVRLASDGAVLWQYAYGTADPEAAHAATALPDGGFVVAGTTASVHEAFTSPWLLRLDASGAIVWSHVLDVDGLDQEPVAVHATSDGILVGGTAYPVVGWAVRAWVANVLDDGTVLFHRTYAGAAEMRVEDLRPTPDGGFVLAGATGLGGHGNFDALVLKADSLGLVEWQRAFGANGPDWAHAVVPTRDCGVLVAGSTATENVQGDLWLMKLEEDGDVAWEQAYGEGGARARHVEAVPGGGYLVTGTMRVPWPSWDGDEVWALRVHEDGSAGSVGRPVHSGASDLPATSAPTAAVALPLDVDRTPTTATPTATNATVRVQA